MNPWTVVTWFLFCSPSTMEHCGMSLKVAHWTTSGESPEAIYVDPTSCWLPISPSTGGWDTSSSSATDLPLRQLASFPNFWISAIFFPAQWNFQIFIFLPQKSISSIFSEFARNPSDSVKFRTILPIFLNWIFVTRAKFEALRCRTTEAMTRGHAGRPLQKISWYPLLRPSLGEFKVFSSFRKFISQVWLCIS